MANDHRRPGGCWGEYGRKAASEWATFSAGGCRSQGSFGMGDLFSELAQWATFLRGKWRQFWRLAFGAPTRAIFAKPKMQGPFHCSIGLD